MWFRSRHEKSADIVIRIQLESPTGLLCSLQCHDYILYFYENDKVRFEAAYSGSRVALSLWFI